MTGQKWRDWLYRSLAAKIKKPSHFLKGLLLKGFRGWGLVSVLAVSPARDSGVIRALTIQGLEVVRV